MKKTLCLLLVALLFVATAFAAPQLSSGLISSAKQAVKYLSSGEYERLVTLLMGDKVEPRRDYIAAHADFNKVDTFLAREGKK